MLDATTAKIIEPWITNHMALGDLIRSAESGGDPNAKNPRSSASGPDQFLDRTWLDTIRITRPDLSGMSDQELLGLKTNPEISGQVRDTYAAQNQGILSNAGLPVTPGTTYLAHFAGPKGAVSVLQADPAVPVAQILGPAVVKANPFLANMTAADLRTWADRKMGGNAGQQPQTAPAPAASPPMTVPQARPIFAQSAPQAPQQAAPSDPGIFAQMPAETMQAPPIFFAPRRPINLAALQGQLAQSPFFPKG